MAGMTGTRPSSIPVMCHHPIASAKDFDQHARELSQTVRGHRPVEVALKDRANRRRCCDSQHGSNRRPTELPRGLDVGTGNVVNSAALIASLAMRGSRRFSARAGGNVDYPVAGGPDTTTNSGRCTRRSCLIKVGDHHPALTMPGDWAADVMSDPV